MGSVHTGDNGAIQQVECVSHDLHADFVMDGNVARDTEVEIVVARPDDAVATDLGRPPGGCAAGRGTHGAAEDIAVCAVTGRASGTAEDGAAHAEEDGLATGSNFATREGEVVEQILDDLVVHHDA